MQQTTQDDDDFIIDLVERALALPPEERRAFLQDQCGGNSWLFNRTWKYVEDEERMGSFLLEPFGPPLPEDDSLFAPGQLLINRFRILREIDSGGMGVVWEATDEKLDRRVAIKCAKTGFGKQLPPEVRHAREISHPNVCKIHEIHTVLTPRGAIDFICMELLEGETLSARLRRGPLLKGEALAVALQLCAGLAEAHRNNVIHGDLKSNNVMLTTGPDGSMRAVIMDFGLARRITTGGQSPSMESLAGTPAYMAPELWKGIRPSVESDIYALGVVFWEIISGKRPSDLGMTSATLSWDERPMWKPPKGFGKWDRILAHCLEADPAHRFHNAEEVAQALGPSLLIKRLITAAAAAVLAIAVGICTYLYFTAPPEKVRLALLPFSSGRESSAIADKLLRGTADRLAHLKGSSRTGFKFISEDKSLRDHVDTPEKARSVLGATHVLRGVLEQQPQAIIVHVYLTDVRSGVNVTEWSAEYQSWQMRYAPTALAGVVTGTLHLPLTEAATVNAAARKDYLAGLSAVRRNSGVDEALGYFKQAVAADCDSPLAYAGLAEAQWFKYNLTGDNCWLDRTTESVRQAEIRNPDLAQVHSIAGLLKANTGLYDPAIAEYLRAIELDPRSGDAYRRLGLSHEGNNQPDEALKVLRKAVEVDPQQYRNDWALGSFYYQQAGYQEASKHFRKAAELAPNEPLVHRDLGAALQNLGSFSAAEGELRTSIRLGQTTKALQSLGVVLMYQGKDREAIPVIAQMPNVGPEQYLKWMFLGTVYRRVGSTSSSKGAYRRGLDLAQAEITKNPHDGSIRSHLAYLCAQLRDKRRAEFEIAQALHDSPRDAVTRYMAVLTYESLGRRNDALKVLANSHPNMIADVNRWPDVADLRQDPRFLQMLTSHSGK